MDGSEYAEQREQLLDSIDQDQKEVRIALQELSGAAEQTFSIGERIRVSPLLWIAGAFAAGAWLGQRAAPAAEASSRRAR